MAGRGLKALFCGAAALALAATDDSATIDAGRDIYETAQGARPIMVRSGDAEWRSAGPRDACRACHGDSGEGGSEGTIAAPALAGVRDGPAVRGWLLEALTRHRGDRGRGLGPAMPRYRLDDRDLAELAAYVAALPRVPTPGVAADSVTIGVDTDGAGLADGARQVLMAELDAIGAEANLFGRAIGFTSRPDAPRIVTIALDRTPRTRSPTLTIRAEAGTAQAPGAIGCGSLDPGAAERLNATITWVERQGLAARVINADGEPPRSEETVIYAQGVAVSPDVASRARRAFVPAETAAGWQQPVAAAGLSLVAPGDINARSATARRLLDGGAVDPREAIVIAAHLEAATTVIDALRGEGRKLRRMALCDSLRTLALTRQSVSLIADGQAEVVPVAR